MFPFFSINTLPEFACCVMSVYMATTTIALTQPAYERLKKQKLPGESFSDVVLREIPEPCETAGDVLESLQRNPPPHVDAKRIDAFLAARGRRSNRRPVRRKAA
jgi:predicted CopG family antitoxin